jgi:transposase
MGLRYSQDLRERVIDAVLVEGMSRRAAAARFGVGESAATNWVKRVELTGSRTPAKLGGYRRMMLAPHRAFIEAACRDKPDITLQGLCDRLLAEHGVKIYISVMSRFLRHLGVTRARRTGRTSAATAGAGGSGKSKSTDLASSSSTRPEPKRI